MDTKKFPYWLAVEESKLVKFSDLAHMMAKAIHPSEDEGVAYGCARINLEKELPDAVHNGDLIVRNASGMGKHQFPYGNALQLAVILPLELRPFLEGRGIELRLMAHGSGPTLWTLENAAGAIAEQEEWHNGARGRLLDQMMEAAIKRELIVRDPHTDLPKATGEIREYYELVTPADVNVWLENNSTPYRWNVTMPVEITGQHEQWETLVRESDARRNEPAFKAEYDRHRRLLDEQSKLHCEERQNFPYIDVEIKKRLSEIRYELEMHDVAEAPVSTPQAAAPTSEPPPAAALPVELLKQWSLTRPQRSDALTGAIYAVLKDAHDANGPLPFPRDVMALCIKKRPHDMIEVTHDEIKFYDSKGDAETANVEAVRKRIERMTEVP